MVTPRYKAQASGQNNRLIALIWGIVHPGVYKMYPCSGQGLGRVTNFCPFSEQIQRMKINVECLAVSVK